MRSQHVRILDLVHPTSGVSGEASPQFCLQLLQCMTLATEGKNYLAEMQCRAVISEEDLVNSICSVDGFRFPFVKVSACVRVLW